MQDIANSMSITMAIIRKKQVCMLWWHDHHLLFADRPWLTEGQKVRKLQEKVYLALQHSLHKSVASDEKLDKVETSICSLANALMRKKHTHKLTLNKSPLLADGVQAAHNEVHL